MTALKRCSFAGADWRVHTTNYPSTEYLFFVCAPLATPIRSVDSGLAGVVGFVLSFFFSWTPRIANFGSLAVAGIVIFTANLLLSYPSVRAHHPMAWFVLCVLQHPPAELLDP
ncbi:MAG TPA: hypothetical protein VMV23_12705 [Candidatus Nanopelagicaceae bacterium]|nr:hypothetical protein [Candidatus Nanopelagicaceae bacterium]